MHIKHKECGQTFWVNPSSFLKNPRCKYCYKKINSSTKYFKEKVYKLVKDEYEVLGEYKRVDQKVLIKHNICGHIYKVTPAMFYHGIRCPRCRSSKGEKIIESYLKRNNFEFKRQYKIKKCRDKLPLPFDFAIFNMGKLIALVEYQGKQHYEAIEYFGGTQILKYTIRHDLIKKNYCKSKNINLIEINYKSKSIEKDLEDKLKCSIENIQLKII